MRFLAKWLPRRNQDADLEDELRSHIAIETERLREQGFPPEQAERIARASFGNITKIQEDVRDTWGWPVLERALDDLRFGLRLLRKTPLWTFTVSTTIALGIGIAAAIFSVVHAVLLAPLPYQDPQRIVALSATAAQSGEPFAPNPALWKHWQRTLSSLEDIALTRPVANFNLTGDGAPERLQGGRFTFNLPRVIGLPPILGRTFTEAEQLAGANVVLLSHRLWTRRFAADPSIVGRKILLNGEPHEVAGVMPREFQFPNATFELWAPLFLPSYDIGHGYNYGYLCTGRLKQGVGMRQAQAEIQSVMQALAAEHPDSYRSTNGILGGLIQPLSENQAATLRPMLLLLSAAVACLLAIGGMSLAVLLIARSSARSRELLVRVALGASRARLRHQLLAEAIPLALLGAVGSIAFAHVFLQALLSLLPSAFPRIGAIALNTPVLIFAVLSSFGIVIAAGLLPSRISTSMQLASAMQRNSRSVAPGNRIRDALVTAQVAIAVPLLLGGLLFTRSFAALLNVHPGFDANALTMHLAVSRSKYKEDTQVADYYRRLAERIHEIPGVRNAGFVNRLPMSGLPQTGGVEFEGRDTTVMVDWRSATPDYFPAMQIPLLAGRNLSDADRADTTPVGLIDASLAGRVFGNENPIGKRFRRASAPGQPNTLPWSIIVGVVGHVLNDSLEIDPRPQAYWPETQRAQDRAALVVRTEGPPMNYTKAIVAAIREENPDQPVYDILSMEEWIGRSMQTRTLATSLVSLFGLASLSLACLGLYGVVSYSATLRLREFGIRVALGATATAVQGLVLRKAGRLAVTGTVVGLLLCWPASQALRTFLYGVGELDLVAWTAAPLALIVISLLAALGPAVRAAHADPAQTLRAE